MSGKSVALDQKSPPWLREVSVWSWSQLKIPNWVHLKNSPRSWYRWHFFLKNLDLPLFEIKIRWFFKFWGHFFGRLSKNQDFGGFWNINKVKLFFKRFLISAITEGFFESLVWFFDDIVELFQISRLS